MASDTEIGGPRGRFPTTRRSAVLGMRSHEAAERERSFDALVAAYWKPVYKHIRLRFGRSNEDAKDLTQGFFLRVLEKDFFAGFDPTRARFRTFLRTCLEGYLANEHQAELRLKRGGGAVLLSLEFEQADGELATREIASPETIERAFEEEWVRSLLGLAVDALEAECRETGKEIPFRLFERYELDPDPGRITYHDLAQEFALPVTTVTNHLAHARREFRRILLDKLRELTASDAEFRMEARALLGIEAP